MATVAARYKNAVTNSANAERSNSLHNIVFSPRRRSLSWDKLKQLVFLYYNLAVKFDAHSPDELSEFDEPDATSHHVLLDLALLWTLLRCRH